MVKTEEKAQQVNLTFAPMIDPTIIILIIEIIIQVIKWYIECNMKSDKALPSIQKPGWLYRWYLRRLVKQVLTKGNKQHLQEQVYYGLLQVGSSMSSSELFLMFIEVDTILEN